MVLLGPVLIKVPVDSKRGNSTPTSCHAFTVGKTGSKRGVKTGVRKLLKAISALRTTQWNYFFFKRLKNQNTKHLLNIFICSYYVCSVAAFSASAESSAVCGGQGGDRQPCLLKNTVCLHIW